MLHIDLPSRSEIERLAQYRGAPAVSIYLRTTPLTQATPHDRIELKNLLKQALGQLEAAATDKRALRAIEEAVEAIADDDAFWVTQANSLAVFATPERVQTFRLPNQLVNAVEVSDRFHLKPLLRAVTFPHHAYVLAIATGAVRLIEVQPELPPHLVAVPGLPHSLNALLGRRSHVVKDGPGSSGDNASESATLMRYARAVDQALRGVLKGESAPLIIAATEPMASTYRRASTYPNLAAQVIGGGADDTADHALAAAARRVLDEIYAAQVAQLRETFHAREAAGRATTDVAQAARAATYGAVDTLLVDMDNTVSGRVDDADGAVSFDEQPDALNYGVADEIARRVLQAGGRVFAVRRSDLPRDADLAAILRYPV